MRTLGTYELLQKIGSGGMAEVWSARRESGVAGQKYVAIKILARHVAEDPRYLEMFISEAKLSLTLSHANIVTVFEVVEDGGECYMVMELIEGMTLSQLVRGLAKRGERLPVATAVHVVAELLRALAYAHALQTEHGSTVVHRDVSPQNVMISTSGEVKLMDFGIARFSTEETSGSLVKGKLQYMPPEQLSKRTREPTIDLFAVGGVLQELLEGKRFRGGLDQEVLLGMVFRGEVPQPSVEIPEALDHVRLRLLEPDPDKRLGSAKEALAMLYAWSGYRNASLQLEEFVCEFVQPASSTSFPAGNLADLNSESRSGLSSELSSNPGAGLSSRSGSGLRSAVSSQAQSELQTESKSELSSASHPEPSATSGSGLNSMATAEPRSTLGAEPPPSSAPSEQELRTEITDKASAELDAAVGPAGVTGASQALDHAAHLPARELPGQRPPPRSPTTSSLPALERDPIARVEPVVDDIESMTTVKFGEMSKADLLDDDDPIDEAQFAAPRRRAAAIAVGVVFVLLSIVIWRSVANSEPEPELSVAEAPLTIEQVEVEPIATETDETGSDNESGGEDETGDDEPSEKKKATKPKVPVVFTANDFFFVYVKVGGRTLTLEPRTKVRLPIGSHAVYLRESKSKSWTRAGSISLKRGKSYRIEMKKPAGLRQVEN